MFLLRTLLVLLLNVSLVSANESPDKWEGYLEFTGKPGTTRSLGVSDLFVPLWQDKNDMSFFNVRGQTENFNDGDFSLGFGHRHMFNNFILGAYGFFDGNESDIGNFYHQWSAGIEVLGDKWDFRANGYLADQETKQLSYHLKEDKEKPIVEQGSLWVNSSRRESLKEEKTSSGYDMEVGYKLPILKDTRVYAGVYHFFGEQGFENVTGPRARIETRLYDLPYLGAGSRLMAGIETQSDDVRGGQTTGMLSLRIPFGVVKKNRTVLTGLDRRMLEPIVKNTHIITTQKETTTSHSARSAFLNPEGLAYTDYVVTDLVDKNMSDIMGEVNELILDGKLPLVVIEGIGLLEFEEAPIIGGATFTLAGKPLNVYYFDSSNNELKTLSITPEGQTPTLNFLGNNDWALELNDRAHINGFDIDAQDYINGALIRKEGTFFITNSTFKNAYKNDGTGDNKYKGNGFFILDDINFPEITVYIEGSEFSDNYNNGLYANSGAKVFIDSSSFDNNLGGGIRADSYHDKGTVVTVQNSTVSKNNYAGLLTILGGEIFADNIGLYENTIGARSELSSNGGKKPYIEITNSVVSDSTNIGLYAVKGDIKAENVLIENNKIGGKSEGHDIGAELEIINSIVRNNNTYGLQVLIDGKLTVQGSLVEGNTWDGIQMFSWNGHSAELEVKDSTITDNGLHGISATTWLKASDTGDDADIFNTVSIENSIISNNGRSGIYFTGAADALIKDSQIFGNKESGITAETLNGYSEDNSNYIIQRPSSITVKKVDFYGNGEYGIWNAGSNITVTEGSSYDNDLGSYFNQTGLRWESGNPPCIKGGAIFTVDGGDVPKTESWPILATHDCTE